MYYEKSFNAYLDSRLLKLEIDLTPAEKFLYIVLDNMRDSDGDIITTYQQLADILDISLQKLYPMLNNVLNYLGLSKDKFKLSDVTYLFLYFDFYYDVNNIDYKKVFLTKLNTKINSKPSKYAGDDEPEF